jgi:LCP family protein required for cell wall assembly
MVWVLGGGFAVMALFSAALVFRTVRGIAAAWTGVGLPDIFTSQSDAEPATSGQPDGPQPTPELSGDSPSWNGVDRINILMMGLDYRDWLTGEGPPRTDSMMLVTIDPITKSAGMLSIPRDLWVEVPGFEHNRINTAYFLGETYRLPGGGPGLAMQTVENLIGVPVPYYAVIEFSAFERFIDEIGGIEILVPERMKISPLGRDSYWLDAKSYLMDGPEALAYARARKTAGGDFDRAERQQQVLMAVRDQVLELDMVATLLGRAPALYQDLRQGIQTNLTLDQLVALGLLAAQVDLQDISKGVIAPPEMVLLDTHLDGAMVLKPVPDQIRALRDEIFTGTGAIAPSVPPETSAEAVQIEHARLAVLNGAGLEGLATDTAEYLQGHGLNVIQIANADRIDYDKSRVIVYSQNYPYTIRYLAELLGLTEGQILQAVFPESDLDLMVILGADWAYGTRP